jgi:hypothetical protein
MTRRCAGRRIFLGWVLGAACMALYTTVSDVSAPLAAAGGVDFLLRPLRRVDSLAGLQWTSNGGAGGFGGMQTPSADGTFWRIPRVLHQTWKTKETPESCAAYRKSWTTLNPTWSVRLWDDAEGDALLAMHFPNLTQALREHNVTEGVKLADITRIAILYVHGGIYADLDMEALRAFDPLLVTHERSPWPVILGAEPSKHADGQGGRNLLICNALMISPARHPFWKTLLGHIEAAVRQQQAGDPYVSPVDLTGPMLYTHLLEHSPEAFGGVVVYPSNAFYPREDDEVRLAFFSFRASPPPPPPTHSRHRARSSRPTSRSRATHAWHCAVQA